MELDYCCEAPELLELSHLGSYYCFNTYSVPVSLILDSLHPQLFVAYYAIQLSECNNIESEPTTNFADRALSR